MTTINKDFLRKLLKEYSLVIVNTHGEILHYSNKSGIRPIVEAVLYIGNQIDGNIVADRVIGKAAALVIANRNPIYVFGSVMSKPAEELLRRRRIDHDFDIIVDAIRARNGELCPFERLVIEIDDPKEALEKIIRRLNIAKNTMLS